MANQRVLVDKFVVVVVVVVENKTDSLKAFASFVPKVVFDVQWIVDYCWKVQIAGVLLLMVPRQRTTTMTRELSRHSFFFLFS
jgi:hypothetical protein